MSDLADAAQDVVERLQAVELALGKILVASLDDEPQLRLSRRSRRCNTADGSGNAGDEVVHKRSHRSAINDYDSRLKTVELTLSAIEAQNERTQTTLQAFVEKSFTVCLAAAVSEMLFSVLRFLSEAAFNGNLPAELLLRTAYVFLLTLFVPSIERILVRIDATETFHGDVARLIKISLGMFLCWAWLDLFKSLDSIESFRSHGGYAICALALMLAHGLYESSSCFSWAQERLEAGHDSILVRYLLLPTHTRLAMGWIWYTTPHHAFQSVKLEQPLKFLVQLIILGLLSKGVTLLATRDRIIHERPDGTQVYERRLKRLLHTEKSDICSAPLCSWMLLTLDVFVSVLGFVLAWTFSDTIDVFVFDVLAGCGSADTCSYQLNFCYAVAITCILGIASARIQVSRCTAIIRSALRRGVSLQVANFEAEADVELWRNAFSLTVGWAWLNFSKSLSNIKKNWVIDQAGQRGQKELLVAACVQVGMCLAIVSTLSLCYHYFLERFRSVELLLETQDLPEIEALGDPADVEGAYRI